mmetsp:Transcript_21878/g.36128  ORF Transcript_21878/g.36128 Transcript_21878/m.36128 type:complete len:496 (+) Transcript_21878:39-1526(+)
MTVLFWPRHADKPLPNTTGVVVGWFHDKDTVICAKILYHNDKEVVKTILKRKRSPDGLQLIGKWDPTTSLGSSPSLYDLQTFVPTSVGPWWSDKKKQDEDLLVYYTPGQVYKVKRNSFASILVRLNHVEMIIDRLKQKPVASEDHQQVKKKRPPKKADVAPAFRHRHSLLMNHFYQNSIPGRIPLLQLLWADDEKARGAARLKHALDFVLGIVGCALILLHAEMLEQALSVVLDSHGRLRTATLWLESFPAGFKLNVPLTRNMGHELLLLLEYWDTHILQTVLGSVGQRTLILQCLALVSLVFGLTTFLAVLVDVVRFFTLDLAVIHTFFAKVHQFQLYMLSSLWKLFRGKKHNPLRQRTDTMEYDSMQLLVGMLAFTFVLFLFTTILVYHAFFGTVYILVQPVGLWLIYGFIKDFPFASMWMRWRHPAQVGVGIYLEEQSPTTVRLCVIPKSYSSVMAKFVRRYPGRVVRLGFAAVTKLITGQRLEMLRDCISD